MFVIENDILRITVNEKGAELDSLFNKKTQLEYLWSGDPAFWAKKSPVLFPIVGTLKDNRYYFEGKAYQLGRHGFARDSTFTLSERSDTNATLFLDSDAGTHATFPFAFCFSIQYSLDEDVLQVGYRVENRHDGEMFFSVGGHPAFKVPLAEGSAYDDHFLEYNAVENAGRWPISPDGLIETEPVPLLHNTRRLPLTRELFYKDALVFKHLDSTSVSIKSERTTHGLEFDFTGFPYLGVWAAKNADFVCIEPWCGIADSVNSSQQLTEKEGIEVLGKGQVFERTWRVKLF